MPVLKDDSISPVAVYVFAFMQSDVRQISFSRVSRYDMSTCPDGFLTSMNIVMYQGRLMIFPSFSIFPPDRTLPCFFKICNAFRYKLALIHIIRTVPDVKKDRI